MPGKQLGSTKLLSACEERLLQKNQCNRLFLKTRIQALVIRKHVAVSEDPANDL